MCGFLLLLLNESEECIQVFARVDSRLFMLRSTFEKPETPYNLRDPDNKLNIPFPGTNTYINSFRYRSAIGDVRQQSPYGNFKT